MGVLAHLLDECVGGGGILYPCHIVTDLRHQCGVVIAKLRLLLEVGGIAFKGLGKEIVLATDAALLVDDDGDFLPCGQVAGVLGIEPLLR